MVLSEGLEARGDCRKVGRPIDLPGFWLLQADYGLRVKVTS